MNWKGLVCSLLIFTAYKSEAFATSFYPSLRARGGETLASSTTSAVLKDPSNGDMKNGFHDLTFLDDSIDEIVEAEFIAETNLPSELGEFKLRGYRIPQSSNEFVGREPCVVYSAKHPPFPKAGESFVTGLPIRVHDQCLTSEVFGSRR